MSMEEEVKILGLWASPFSLRLKIAQDHKGINYKYNEEDLANKSQLLLQSNPVHKKIAVLIHNEKPICESRVILQYIDETWPALPLLPKDPYGRAMALFWAAFIDDKFAVSFREIYITEGTKQEKAIEETVANFSILEEALKGKPFFGGELIGYVDMVLGSRAVWIGACEEIAGVKLIDASKTALLYAWIQRFCSVDCVKKSLPDLDKLVGYAYAVPKRYLQGQ